MGFDRERYISLLEAVERTGYTYEHIRRLVKSGAIAVLTIDEHKYLVDWPDLQRYMAEKPQRKPHSDSRSQRPESE